MNPRDEYLIMQGFLLGAAYAAQQMQVLDQRVQKIEKGVMPALRVLRKLMPAGKRDGVRVYRIKGSA